MAYSYTAFTGNGSTTQYAVSFPYIRREHVAVTVAGVPSTFTWVNNSLIQMDAAPANGAAVRVYRTTPISAPLVDFADGATLVAADLDTNSRQSIYIQQELDDAQTDNLPNVIPNGNKGDITTSVGGTVWAINTGAITEAKLGTGAVTETKLGTGAVTEAKIGTGAVTEAKIGTGAVTEAKLGTGSVTSAKILDGTIVDTDVNASAGITATKLAFTQSGTGATARTVDSKLKDTVSVKDFGAVGDGVADDTAAIQAAINASQVVYFPIGTYKITASIAKPSPNPSRVRLYGAGKYKSIIKAASSLTNTKLLEFGNTDGHGAPQAEITDLGFDGHAKANNNVGVYLKEGGVCHLSSIYAINCGTAIGGYGATDFVLDGKSFITECEIGVNLNYTPPGVSTLVGVSNTAKITNAWFTACNQAVYAEGDQIFIANCVAQSCGIDGTKHVFEVNNTDYVGSGFYGCNIFNNWIEGGIHKYSIAAINAPSSKIFNNFVIGQGGLTPPDREGGILIQNSALSEVYENVCYQFFTGPLANGRLSNAGIYVVSSANTGQNWKITNNTLYRNQSGNGYYFEGLPSPTLSKDGYIHIWGHVTISGATATVANGKNITNVIQFAPGVWQVNFSYNRESTSTPLFVTPLGTSTLSCSYADNGVASVRVWFRNDAGTLTDPDGFNIMSLAEQNVN